ncbi:MAG TPA: YceI family protein [Polyangia bacterium]
MILKQWKIDSTHSSIGFSARHMVVSTVRGRFTRWSGSFVFAESVPGASSVEVAIDAGSIDTGVAERDAHLRSIDFLEAARHPLITFRSTMIEPAGTRLLTVTGDLTIRGVTREVTLDVEYGGRVRDPLGKERVGFSAHTTVSRKEFGITFQQALANGSLVVGDKLEIAIEVEAIEQPARVLSPTAAVANVL